MTVFENQFPDRRACTPQEPVLAHSITVFVVGDKSFGQACKNTEHIAAVVMFSRRHIRHGMSDSRGIGIGYLTLGFLRLGGIKTPYGMETAPCRFYSLAAR